MSEEKNKKLILKFNEIQEEILKIGWLGVLEKYHPDMNCEDPEAPRVFAMYKSIFENMKKRLVMNP